MNIGLLGAFLGGVLTLLSPCSVMLLPAFFSYAFSTPRQVLSRTGVFYLGLITTLVPLGILAGAVGTFLNQNRDLFLTIAASIVIALGVIMALNLPFLRLRGAAGLSSTSALSVYALGTVYGLAGVCAGPMLGAVLTIAAMSTSALYGGIILIVFAAGMAFPLLIIAVLWSRLPAIQKLVRPREVRIGRWRNTWTGLVGGILTSAIGVFLLLTKGTQTLGGVLGATDQARLEGWVLTATQGVPDLWLVSAAIVAVGIVWLLLRRSKKRNTSGGIA